MSLSGSVLVSVKVHVKVVVSHAIVKLAVGAVLPAGAVTVTLWVTLLVAPSSSVTVRVTLFDPSLAKVTSGVSSPDVGGTPSWNVQLRLAMFPSLSVLVSSNGHG
jgi:hypothetical protein